MPNPKRTKSEKRIGAVVITVSDRGSRGDRVDQSGPAVSEMLETAGVEIVDRRIVPDDKQVIRKILMEYCDRGDVDLVVTTGGTGVSPRDVTPDATSEVIDREIPGMAEAMRRHSAAITPHAMLSRELAGTRGNTLIVNLPGSPKAACENLRVLLPALHHAIEKITGDESECSS